MKRAVKQMLPVYVLSFLANVVSAIVILRYGMSYSGQWEKKERIVNGRLFGLYDPSCIYCDLGVS